MVNIDKILSNIIKSEGGYVNISPDKGGATNHGITQATLSDYLGKQASIDDVKNLTVSTACDIYKKNYYQGPHIDNLPDAIQPIVLDTAVNSGPKKAIKMLQGVINDAAVVKCDVDGVCGPGTCRAALLTYQSIGNELINDLVDARIAYFREIVGNNPSQLVFLKGWEKRAESFRI